MTHEKEIEILVATRKRISDPKHWTQFTFARDDQGEKCSAFDDAATCWCLEGAFLLSSHDCTEMERGRAWDAMEKYFSSKWGYSNPAVFNDSDERRHPQVLKALDELIENYEEWTGSTND